MGQCNGFGFGGQWFRHGLVLANQFAASTATICSNRNGIANLDCTAIGSRCFCILCRASDKFQRLALVVATVAAAAVLLQLAREQLAQRQMAVAIQWIVLIAATLVWAIPAIESCI